MTWHDFSVRGLVCVLVAVGGCGGGDTPECQFNSDCPAGRYCAADSRCTADCADDSDCVADLGAGAVCDSFGMCIAPPDGGPPGFPDAYFMPPTDSGPPAEDATADARADATAPEETCTRSEPGATAEDEDADGAIDEGCEWHFGRPHAATHLHLDDQLTLVGGTSADGLRVYLTGGSVATSRTPPPACDPPHTMLVGDRCVRSCGAAGGDTCDASACAGFVTREAYDCSTTCCNRTGLPPLRMDDRALFVATRPSLTAPFSPPVRVAGITDNAMQGATVTPDELVVVFDSAARGSASDLHEARRERPADAFGPATPIAATAGPEEDSGPRLSPDGLELWFTRASAGSRGVWHTRRPTRSDPFEPPTAVTFSGTTVEDIGASPSADGLTVFFSRNNGSAWSIYRAERASRDTLTFETPVEVAALSGAYTTVTSATLIGRELWLFTNRAWTPGQYGVFRAQVCRDGPCDEPLVPCATGTRSPDGFHCYFAGPSASTTWSTAVTDCATRGAHVATLHSDAEAELLRMTFGAGPAWVAASDEALEGDWQWDWSGRLPAEDPHEPFLLSMFHAGKPNGLRGDSCGARVDARISDTECTRSYPYACEDDTWPVW